MINYFSIDELSATYGIAKSTIQRNFKRVQEILKEKYDVELQKEGRGANAFYYIKQFNPIDTKRAVSLYKSVETNMMPAVTAAGLLDLHFLIFIAIVSTPQRVFRGSYVDLLNYIEIKPSIENISTAQQILHALAEKKYIMYIEDETDSMYFMAGILRRTEQEMQLEIDAVLHFQKIVAGTRKSWIPLMKTYLAVNFLDQPCTIKTISAVTNLSEYKIRDCLTLLDKNNIISKERVCLKDEETGGYTCLGTDISVNAFGIQSSEEAVEK